MLKDIQNDIKSLESKINSESSNLTNKFGELNTNTANDSNTNLKKIETDLNNQSLKLQKVVEELDCKCDIQNQKINQLTNIEKNLNKTILDTNNKLSTDLSIDIKNITDNLKI